MHFDPATHRAMQTTLDHPRRAGAGPWLHLLATLLDLAEGKAELIRHGERAWASATFSGSRHTVLLAFTGAQAVEAGEALIALLSDHEFTLPVVAAEHTALPEPHLSVEVELLVLDDA